MESEKNINKIIHIQKILLVLIKKYENKTRQLLDCDIDEIPKLVNSRESILNRIGSLTREILKYCDRNSLECRAFENKCSRGELPEELTEIFDLRQEFNIYGARAHSMEPEIIERIKIIKDDLLIKIKENNSDVTAKAAKYYRSGLNQGKNFYFPENKKKI